MTIARASAVMVLLLSVPAAAMSSGIAGFSGKQGAACNGCHSGGTAPIVEIDGPARVNAGQSVTYTLRIETSAAFSGMAVTATDGVKLVAGSGTKLLSGEVVHAETRAPSAGVATYTFSMQAPAFGGTVRLWGAGLAASGEAGPSGDQAATTVLDVTVDGPPAANDMGTAEPGDTGGYGSVPPGGPGGPIAGTAGTGGGSADAEPAGCAFVGSTATAASSSTSTLAFAIAFALTLASSMIRRRGRTMTPRP